MNNNSSTSTTWISVADTALLLKVRPSTVIRRIEKGTIPARTPSDMPFTYDGKPNYEVRLDALSQRHQYQYLYSHLPETDICSVDLVSPRCALGNVWLDEFLDIAAIIHDATIIRQRYHNTGQTTKYLRQLSERHGISLATLYRIIGKPAAKEISLLYTDPFFLQKHLPHTMCLWSCDFVYALYLDSEKDYSQNEILEELCKKRDSVLCSSCPYHPDNVIDNNDLNVAICSNPQTYMVTPNHRKTINRLLEHLPPQMILYARQGFLKWRAQYGLFVVRDRPLLINECWQGDHHKFDLFVRITIRRERGSKIYEKEVAVRPTLTAWLDSASGCFVGWVISVIPNSDTIAEAFCRAAVLTPGVPFRGLPLSIIVDRGKDYRSKLLEDIPDEMVKNLPEDSMLNKRFAGLGLLPSMDVKVHHALARHPQSKPIERYFGIIEEGWINKLPGWCHNSIETRPDNFQKKLNEQLKAKELFTLEEFVSYFQNTILPEYHNSIDTETTIPELPGWHLSTKSMSPLQRYDFLEKARTNTPDWSTISILKMHRSPDHAIKKWGIRFANTWYQADKLSEAGEGPVDILFHKVQSPYAPSSVSVIYNNHYLCEAFPAERRHFTGDDPMDIMLDSNRQKRPEHEMKASITRIRQSTNSILPEKAKSKPTEKIQIYDMTYAPSVEEEQIDISASSDYQSTNTGESCVKKGLAFLFGEE